VTKKVKRQKEEGRSAVFKISFAAFRSDSFCGWDGFLAAIKGLEVPESFLSKAEREQIPFAAFCAKCASGRQTRGLK
jgi:hypothetical protein